jgi:hypothetical protein
MPKQVVATTHLEFKKACNSVTLVGVVEDKAKGTIAGCIYDRYL